MHADYRKIQTLVIRNTYCNNGCTNALHCYVYVTCLSCSVVSPTRFVCNQLSFARSFIFADKHILFYRRGSGCEKQPFSPYLVSIIFPSRLRSYFGCVIFLAFWTQGSRAVHGPIGVWEKIIILESLCSTFSALVGTIATKNVLILHCRTTCLACALTPKC